MQARIALVGLLAVAAKVAAQPLDAKRNVEFDAINDAAKRNLVKHTGFVFDYFAGDRQDTSPNAFQVPGTVDNDAFLSTLDGVGASVNFLNLGPCAGSVPHSHPRGTQVSTIVRGNVQFGYVEENAGENRLVVVDARAGQVVFIPQGLMHFNHNLGCTPAAFVANFGNRDPGVQTTWASLLQVPTSILAAALNIDDSQEKSEAIINQWKSRQLVSNPATGGADCLARCGISYQQANNFSTSPLKRAQSSATKPIVPLDQKGNPQSFQGGGVNATPAQRCDFVGLTQLPAQPGPNTCASSVQSSGKGGYRRLHAEAQRVLAQLPQHKITVMDAADLVPTNK